MSKIQIIWLGHSSFKIFIGDQVILLDPWLKENPLFPNNKLDFALSKVNYIILSHAHSDHASETIEYSKVCNAPIIGIYDYVNFLEKNHQVKVVGFNRGGTLKLGNVNITMVSASHSSSFYLNNKFYYGGNEAGYMSESNGRTIYFSGDTDIMADMEFFEEFHKPEIGILSAGGHFTMNMERAAYAAKKYFNFKTIIPCHFKTFPILEQNSKKMKDKLKDENVEVIETEILKVIKL